MQEGSTHVGGGGGRGDANKLRFSQADKRGGEARGSPGEGATVRIARMWTCAQAALALLALCATGCVCAPERQKLDEGRLLGEGRRQQQLEQTVA